MSRILNRDKTDDAKKSGLVLESMAILDSGTEQSFSQFFHPLFFEEFLLWMILVLKKTAP